MILEDITTNVAFMKCGEGLLILVGLQDPDGNLNVWDISVHELNCMSTTAHDYYNEFEFVKDESEDLTKSLDWRECEDVVMNAFDELHLVERLLRKY